MSSFATNLLLQTAEHERPQERLQRHGPAALSDAELIAMLLRNGIRGQDVLTTATQLIGQAGSLSALIGWRPADFRRVKGIGTVKALQIVTAMELARRIVSQQAGLAPVFGNADDVFSYFSPIALGLEVEKFWVLCLNRRSRLLRNVEVTSGTASSTLVHPREVFREAIREGASSIICIHNHPSGDPSPSGHDIKITEVLRQAATTVDVALMDHIIVGRRDADPTGRGYYSFRAAGQL